MSESQSSQVDRGEGRAASEYGKVGWAARARAADEWMLKREMGKVRGPVIAEFHALCESRLKALRERSMLTAISASVEECDAVAMVELQYLGGASHRVRISILPCRRRLYNYMEIPRWTWRGRAELLLMKAAGK